MTHAFQRALVGVANALVLALIVSGCAGSASNDAQSKAVGTAGSTPATIDVQTTSLFVTVENRAGQPLLDMDVTIRQTGRAMPYVATIRRMDSGEKRDLSLGEFMGADNTTRFSLRRTHPKEVVVTAVDLVGKRHEVTAPWNR